MKDMPQAPLSARALHFTRALENEGVQAIVGERIALRQALVDEHRLAQRGGHRERHVE